MPQETHSGIPASIVAGDSIQFTDAPPDDVSEVSTATYRFKNPDTGKTFQAIGEASGSGNDYVYNIKGGDTAKLAGAFVGQLVVEYSWGRETPRHRTATVRLTPNPEAKHQETHAAGMVRILQGYLEGDKQFLSGYTFGGIPIEKLDHEAAKRLLDNYRADVRDEIAKARVSEGRADGRTVKTRFVKP